MPPTEVITPSTITKDLPTDQEPETIYNWARQVRKEKVALADVVKQDQLRSRRSRRTKAAKSRRKRG